MFLYFNIVREENLLLYPFVFIHRRPWNETDRRQIGKSKDGFFHLVKQEFTEKVAQKRD